ncbi:MAG: GNAT family N-acetyltransferase [Bacteroidia bacterium]|nr:GNAT family N-acetyltransferase [Bacteroidia bacterium]
MLETERLYLVPFGAEDLGLLHHLFTHPYIREHLWDGQEIDLEESMNFISANKKYFQHYRWGLWKILSKTLLEEIGFAGLWPLFEDPQPQLLYGLLPQYSKQGFASEAASKVVDYAFEELAFPYVKASMDTNHIDSSKLASRLGMSMISDSNLEGRPTAIYCLNAPVPQKASNLN